MPLAPLKALDKASDTVGLSVSPLNPVKSLLAASEIEGASDTNFPAPLFITSDIAARLSAVLLNPVNVLVTLSDIADTELSDTARAPVKTVATTSEGTMLSSENFPAPLLIVSDIAARLSDSDFTTPLFTTSDIADNELSETPLAPVRALPVASEIVKARFSAIPLAPVKTRVIVSPIIGDSERNLPTPLPITPVIVARLSVRPLDPSKNLFAMSEIGC